VDNTHYTFNEKQLRNLICAAHSASFMKDKDLCQKVADELIKALDNEQFAYSNGLIHHPTNQMALLPGRWDTASRN